jgi:hypothetical protein
MYSTYIATSVLSVHAFLLFENSSKPVCMDQNLSCHVQESKLTTSVTMGADYIGRCKSNHQMMACLKLRNEFFFNLLFVMANIFQRPLTTMAPV